MTSFRLDLLSDSRLHHSFRYPNEAIAYLSHLQNELINVNTVSKKIHCLGNIGVTLLLLNRLQEAEVYLSESVNLAKFQNNPIIEELIIQQSLRLANTYQWQKNYKKSDILFLEIIELIKSNNSNSRYLDFAFQHYGKSLLDQHLFAEADYYFNEALKIRKTKNDLSLIESTEEALIYCKTMDMMNQYEYLHLPKKLFDILQLETINMWPILDAARFVHKPDKLLESIEKSEHIVTIYDRDTLIGVMRYNILDQQIARVWTFQIRNFKTNKSALRPLLKATIDSFKKNQIAKIVTHAHHINKNSIDFHCKLGFSIVGSHEFTKEFQLNIDNAKNLWSKFL